MQIELRNMINMTWSETHPCLNLFDLFAMNVSHNVTHVTIVTPHHGLISKKITI